MGLITGRLAIFYAQKPLLMRNLSLIIPHSTGLIWFRVAPILRGVTAVALKIKPTKSHELTVWIELIVQIDGLKLAGRRNIGLDGQIWSLTSSSVLSSRSGKMEILNKSENIEVQEFELVQRTSIKPPPLSSGHFCKDFSKNSKYSSPGSLKSTISSVSGSMCLFFCKLAQISIIFDDYDPCGKNDKNRSVKSEIFLMI